MNRRDFLKAIAAGGAFSAAKYFAWSKKEVLAQTPNPQDVGQWEPVAAGLSGIHGFALLEGYSILFTGGTGSEFIFHTQDPNPNNWTWEYVPLNLPGALDIFCSGHTFFSNGDLLFVGGGSDPATGRVGHKQAFRFNVVSRTWTRLPDMIHGRYYPIAVPLYDGRIFVVGGDAVAGYGPAKPETYDPASDTWTLLSSYVGGNFFGSYPELWWFLSPTDPASNRLVSMGGSGTKWFNVDDGTWIDIDVGLLRQGDYVAVMYAPGKIMRCGALRDSFGKTIELGVTEILDLSEFTPTWRRVGNMVNGRGPGVDPVLGSSPSHNPSILPDGKVLVTGGVRTQNTEADSIKMAEVWDPKVNPLTWTALVAEQDPRLYHSTGFLLRTARVVSNGGETSTASFNTAQVYSPYYLFRGPRPTISSAPSAISYGKTFDVLSPDALGITRITLLPLAATTHTFNMNQYFNELNFTLVGGTLRVTAPLNHNYAPRGPYWLFIMNSSGVPSEGFPVLLQ